MAHEPHSDAPCSSDGRPAGFGAEAEPAAAGSGKDTPAQAGAILSGTMATGSPLLLLDAAPAPPARPRAVTAAARR
ncbi:hypothetical protein GQ55_9G606000 [Panicum hallii var. hallii]|uniref:Uncharacterized protein n=1 Tax=Panicum hallii var. hallii TaxID=1504633 RepID=A0A2T7CHC8_9POAL|nr:hypothetical protein GQ55_9G606000 [Panicum hallii var. hallii]